VTDLSFYSPQFINFMFTSTLAKGATTSSGATLVTDQYPAQALSETVTAAYDNSQKTLFAYTPQIQCDTSAVSLQAFANLTVVCQAFSGNATFVLYDTVCNTGNVASVYTVGDNYGNTHGQVTVAAQTCANLTSPVESLYTSATGTVTASGYSLVGAISTTVSRAYACQAT